MQRQLATQPTTPQCPMTETTYLDLSWVVLHFRVYWYKCSPNHGIQTDLWTWCPCTILANKNISSLRVAIIRAIQTGRWVGRYIHPSKRPLSVIRGLNIYSYSYLKCVLPFDSLQNLPLMMCMHAIVILNISVNNSFFEHGKAYNYKRNQSMLTCY